MNEAARRTAVTDAGPGCSFARATRRALGTRLALVAAAMALTGCVPIGVRIQNMFAGLAG